MGRELDSLRGWSRRTGISREWLADRIADGSLRAFRRGERRVEVLREDLVSLLRRYELRPTQGDVALVERRLQHEQSGP